VRSSLEKIGGRNKKRKNELKKLREENRKLK
jgi:hypothetical protein